MPEPEDEPEEEEEEEEEDDEGGSEQFEQESVVESSAVTTVAEVKPEDYDAKRDHIKTVSASITKCGVFCDISASAATTWRFSWSVSTRR